MGLEMHIIFALLLDLLVGDPRWLPHPVQLIGWFAIKVEPVSRCLFQSEKTAGIIALCIVVSMTFIATWAILKLTSFIHPLAAEIVSVYMIYSALASKDLAVHGKAVFNALARHDLHLARKKVALLVSRDTDGLDESGVSRACVESVAENIVDGVTAPLFFAVIGGAPGVLVYKAINTLDSTFGYKNERYLHFGWAAARLDDLVNLIPARITSLFIVLATALMGMKYMDSWRILRRDRRSHPSPNSGYSEAAVAGALGIQLGGSDYYFGTLHEKPTLGDNVIPPDSNHILQANRLLYVTTLLAASFFIGGRLILLN